MLSPSVPLRTSSDDIAWMLRAFSDDVGFIEATSKEHRRNKFAYSFNSLGAYMLTAYR